MLHAALPVVFQVESLVTSARNRGLNLMSSEIADVIAAADQISLAYKGAKIQLALLMCGKLNRGTASDKNKESMKAVM